MKRPLLFLACVGLFVAAVGCGNDAPPVVPGAGATIPPIGGGGTGGSGGTGGVGGAGGTGGTGGNASIQCVDLPDQGNSFSPRFNGVAETFTAEVAFSAWIPDRCDVFRQITLGFNNQTCSLDAGSALQIVIPETEFGRIVVGQPYQIFGGLILVTIRLQIGDRIWGNCLRSNGFLTFQRKELQQGGTIQAQLTGTLTDCATPQGPSTVNVAGTRLQVPAPLDCP